MFFKTSQHVFYNQDIYYDSFCVFASNLQFVSPRMIVFINASIFI